MKVLFVIAIALCAMVCDAQVAPQELKKALLDLYKATKGDTWTTKTNWNTGNDICTWYGVKCLEHMHNVTTDLVLKSNNLVGSIPASISVLKDLKNIGFIR